MRLIGVNGFKRSGKGETGLAIQDLLYTRYQTTTLLGFADKMKILGAKTLGFVTQSDAECIALMDECKEEWIFNIVKMADEGFVSETGGIFPMVREYVYHSLTGREYLQHLGTEARNVFGANFWVDQVLPKAPPRGYESAPSKLLRLMYGTDAVVFTDLRFENEAERILALDGEVWEVLRPGTNSDGHASEQVLPRHLISRQIHNSSDLDNLKFQVDKALGL